MLASCTHHAPSALGVLGRGDGSCRSEPDAQWCARARARDGHPNGHPGARGFASVYPRRRGSDARTRVGPAVRAADPQMQFPRLHCIFISRIEFRLRRNAPPFGQSARHETADTGPHRRTARHPHAPHAPEHAHRLCAASGVYVRRLRSRSGARFLPSAFLQVHTPAPVQESPRLDPRRMSPSPLPRLTFLVSFGSRSEGREELLRLGGSAFVVDVEDGQLKRLHGPSLGRALVAQLLLALGDHEAVA